MMKNFEKWSFQYVRNIFDGTVFMETSFVSQMQIPNSSHEENTLFIIYEYNYQYMEGVLSAWKLINTKLISYCIERRVPFHVQAHDESAD